MMQDNWFDKQCIGELVSGTLSLGILMGSMLLQVPQIMNILNSGSVEGLAAFSLYASVIIPITFISYSVLQGNPFATWGENVFSLAQNIVLVALFWRLGKPAVAPSRIIGMTVGFALFTVGCFLLPSEQQGLLPLSTLPLITASRVPQIVANYQNGHTGPLSIISFLLVLLGSSARIYTTIMQVGWDLSLIANYAVSALLSGVLAAQVAYYSSATSKKIA